MAGPDFRSAAVLAAQHAGIDPAIFSRQISQESGFNPNAMSPAGAVGIAQIVPRYHPDVNPRNPLQSLRWAANYDAGLIKKYGGWAPALSVYNSGQPNSYKDPHFAKGQTFNYVKNILSGQNSSLNTNTKSIGGSYQRAPGHAPGTQAAVANWLLKQSMNLLNGGYGQSTGSLFNALTPPSLGRTGAPVASQGASQPARNLSSAKGELALPATFKATHDTGGLAGFPAVDNFAAAGTPVLAPVSGKLVYAHTIPWNQGERVGGETVYLQGDNGKTYFLTHLSGKVPTGRITAGTPIGSVAAVPNNWWPTHIHEGVYNGIYNPPGA